MSPRIALSALQQRDFLTGTGRYIAETFRALGPIAPQHEFSLYIKPDQTRLYPTSTSNTRHRLAEGCPSSPPRRALWELLHFDRMLRQDGIDLYHGPANFLPPRKSCPFVLTLHDLVYFHNPGRTFFLRAKYWQYYIRSTWRMADAILTVSEFSKREIIRYLGVPADMIHVVHNGVDQRFLTPAPASEREAMRAANRLDFPYILYVGRLDPDKNVDALIEAYALLLARGLKDWKLVIAGAKEFRTSTTFGLVEKFKLQDRVVFTGHIGEDHLVPLYQEAAAFCYPSLNEGFGLPVLEAMAAGAPTVTSNVSSLPEVAGDAAATVDPRSPAAIADALQRLLTTDEGPAARERGIARARTFTWSRAAAQKLEVYEKVLTKSRQ